MAAVEVVVRRPWQGGAPSMVVALLLLLLLLLLIEPDAGIH